MNNYTYEDKLEFQRKEQWIAFENMFRTLCEFYKDRRDRKEIMIEAAEIVQWMGEQWPMQEIKDEPFDEKKMWRSPVKNTECECGAQMKYVEAGVSKKTGKPYKAFWSCPVCHKTRNI